MKNVIFKNLLLAFLTLSAVGLSAQTSQTYEMLLPYPVTRTIVREWAAPVNIVYAETAHGNYFIHNDIGAAPKIAEIDATLSVSDFAIDDDFVFFCGNSTSGRPFFGFFHIPDLFFGSGAYAIDDSTINTQSGTLAKLSKMVFFKDIKFRQIAAIGTSSTGLPCVVHSFFTSPTASNNIDVEEVPIAYDESLLDIALTNDYIVTTGFSAQSSTHPYLSLRLYDKDHSDFFNHCNTGYYFTTQSNEYRLEPTQLVSDKLAYNFLSIAAYYRYDKASGGDILYTPEYGTYIGMFSVISSTPPSINHTTSIAIPSIRTHGGWQLHEITDVESSNLDFFLLHDIERDTTSGCISTIYEMSYSSLVAFTPVNAKSAIDHTLNSIDNFNTSQYTASGFSHSSNNLALATETPGSITCLNMDILQPSQITIVGEPKEDPLGLKMSNIHLFKTFFVNSVNEAEVNPFCQQ